jgi:hydrogenase-4 component B
VTAVQAGLLAQFGLSAVAVLLAFAVRSTRARSLLCGTGCAVGAGFGVLTGALAMTGGSGSLDVSTALPHGRLLLAPDRLGGLFMVVVSAVAVLVAVFAIGYARDGATGSRTSWAALAVFTLAMQMVPACADMVGFLLAWELMAFASTALVLTDQQSRPAVRSAALWYAAMTQLSFLLVLAGLSVLTGASGGTAFVQMSSVSSGSMTAAVAFVLLGLGFGTKAGLVPLHVWLPRAHAEAPSHVSAAMSAAMVTIGVYGLVLVCVRLLPGGPAWWGVALVSFGAISAMFGILQASVASDLKRLLAYSTTENAGLIVLALGASVLLRASNAPAVADAALTACLLLVVSHAAFKVTLFLGAGSVLHATGERDLDRLGGLATRMPWTGGAFGVASLGAAALPVTCGFVAEWALLQALIHGARGHDRLVTVVMPLAVAVVALTAGLALLAFVKAFGIGFLARPRSEPAAVAHESPLSMRVALVAGATVVLVLGFVPGPVGAALADAVGAHGVTTTGLGGLKLSSLSALLDPVALSLMSGVVALPVLVAALALARRHPRRSTELAWGSGGARVSPRMQYTATSYAEPLMRVFDDALQPSRDVQVTHLAESQYLVERVEYQQRLGDVVEDRVYQPVLRLAAWVGVAARRLQNGSIHRYLGYSFLALLVVLVAVSL